MRIVHDTLPCGIEYGAVHLPRRHVVSVQIRLLSGLCREPVDQLGIGRLVSETIDKGTEQRNGQALSDAFDAIGASHGGGIGRETTSFTCTVLPDHFEEALALLAEFVRRPTFPEDAFRANLELARQEWLALDDDAQGLTDKIISRRAYGPILGRHALGEPGTIDRITRDDLVAHWRREFHAGRMIAVVSGPIEPTRAADALQTNFDGFGSAERGGRQTYGVEFTPGAEHHAKDLEQQHIGICWPGVDAAHDAFPTQQVMLGVLSGGMGARLFTEVREKQGLVYWVSAWHETPRGSGMVFMGASTQPERCDRTYATLLHEVDRLVEDVDQDELDRAVTGIVSSLETRGDATRARCSELGNDLLFFGRPVSEEEKIAKVKAVTIDGIREYLNAHPRDRLCVVTLGPKPLGDGITTDAVAVDATG